MQVPQVPDLTKPRADPKAWAKVLIAKHERGEWVRPISLRFAREALRQQPKQGSDE